jgi:hypothetical protein
MVMVPVSPFPPVTIPISPMRIIVVIVIEVGSIIPMDRRAIVVVVIPTVNPAVR